MHPIIGNGKSDEVVFEPGFVSTRGTGTGIFYSHGHYDFASTDANLTQASPNQTLGVANEPSGTHVAIVAGGAGSASGGAGPVRIRANGTSITELGVRTPNDDEILVEDITTLSLNQYVETTKKWNGTVTLTLENAPGSTQTAFSADFNYGHCKYTDRSDRNFIVKELKIEGLAGASDTGFNIRLLHHSAIGWTYVASGFVPGNGEIISLTDEYGAESDLANGENYAYDRVGLDTEVQGAGSEGYILETTTTQPNAIQYQTSRVGVLFK